jgi:3'-5' exoribonuclease
MDQQPMLGDATPFEGPSAAPAPHDPGRPPEHRSLASLCDGDRVDGHYVIRDRSRRPTKKGGEWLALKISDRSAGVSAKAFDDVATLFEAAVPGTIVQVRGRFEASQQWGNSVIVEAIAPAADGGYDASALLETSPIPLERLEGDLRALLDTIRTPDLVALLDRFFAPGTANYERFRDAPAAKHYHQAYRHGLLEHALTVAQSVSAAASFFPGIDRDVAVTGALLHDIGKLEAYNDDPLAIDLTDLGRLHGEIPLGYYHVRSEIERIDGLITGWRARSSTSSSATMAPWSTAPRSCPAPARRSSST